MPNIQDVVNELMDLLDEGAKLQVTDEKNKDLSKLAMNYESWYTRARSAVNAVIPERLEDFDSAYKVKARKEVQYDTYTISDYLLGLVVRSYGKPAFDTDQAYQVKLLRQLSIIKAAMDAAPSTLHDIKSVLRAELFDNDIDSARDLFKKKHLRSSGVICGVVLEAHLKSIADKHKIKFRKKSLTISDLNDALKNEGVFETPMWRFIQRLGDIRNYCGHSKEREPSKDEVEDLIRGTEKVIKEVF